MTARKRTRTKSLSAPDRAALRRELMWEWERRKRERQALESLPADIQQRELRARLGVASVFDEFQASAARRHKP